MPAPIIPWEPCNIPEEIQDELNRRKINRSLKYVDVNKGEWGDQTGEWSKYRGPMVPWVRLCSNGKGSPKVKKEGFVLYGGKGFYADYGFTKSKNNPSIIGYVPDSSHGTHTIDNDLANSDYPIHVPSPEIERIQVTMQQQLFRRATVEWVCFSKKQLEYMTPYFLIPGITCIMEWGWNHYNPISLVDLTDTSKLADYFMNPYSLYTKNIIKSRGNYDVIFGIVSNFEWTVDGNKIRCKTEITSKDRLYAGLVVDSNAVETTSKDDEKESAEHPLNSLIQFVDKTLDKFRNVVTTAPEAIEGLTEFAKYVKESHKAKGNGDEYLYGVFVGRDPKDKVNKFQNKPDKDNDFDYKTKNKELWLNLGLIVDAVNFHTYPYQGVKSKEMFRVDIDDVVVCGHPNMISSDGFVCLIPNADAPKYFNGAYGPTDTKSSNYSAGDWAKFNIADNSSQPYPKNRASAKADGILADYRVYSVCKPMGGKVHRDNIDQVINVVRYEKSISKDTKCAFPFKSNEPSLGDKPYPARWSGYLKHIYVNVGHLKTILGNADIKTYYKFLEKLLEDINGACGSFWDLRIVSAEGDKKVQPGEPAPMKIVDYKFMHFSNRGRPWTFDYYDADSLLLGISFKPTLSNAQAIRSMFAKTNNPNNTVVITDGTNELLDYHFEDRLNIGQGVGTLPPAKKDMSGYTDTLREIQGLVPCNGAFQMTTDTHVRRLAMPAADILSLFLDDGDEANNPKYTGIMPGIQATFTVQGIGGLRTFMMFLVRNLPEPYSEKNIVFRIVDVQETIEAGKWTTQITAGIIPLRQYIKDRLGITFN